MVNRTMGGRERNTVGAFVENDMNILHIGRMRSDW